MDWKNAFNELDRGETLKAFAKRHPGMLTYTMWANRQPSHLAVIGTPEETPLVLSEWAVRSASFLAELSVSSPQKLFIFII